MIEDTRPGVRLFLSEPGGELDRPLLLGRIAILFLCAVMPFSHNAALKNLALAGMLVSTLWLAACGRLVVDWRSPILRAIGFLLLLLTATASLGRDPLDSLGELRKHFLPGVLTLLLVPLAFRGERLTRLLLAVIACAFLVRTGLAMGELAHYFPDLDTGRSEGDFIKGFSLDAGFYVPVLMALLLLGGRWRWLAPLGLLAILTVMLLVQSRTPLVAMLLSVVVMLFVLRKWRILLFTAAGFIAVGGYLAISQPQVAERLASTFSRQTYMMALDIEHYAPTEGLAARMPIWFGVLEVTAGRSLTGYGFGWKKLGRIAVEDGYVARWASQENDAFTKEQAWYFSLPPSKVNPHNLYLQIYFESGLLGLLAYGVMLLVLFWQALRLSWRVQGASSIVAAMVLAYLTSHVILGFGNGLWIGLGPSLALIALLEAVRLNEKKA